jgi:phosphoribosylformimino-5-aminoimidazole carboxamide ribotide isomerase
MIVYPAIDLRNGRCVRLRQGDPAQETVFSDDPVAAAVRWVEQGAEWLHVVDLDGAFAGGPQNEGAIRGIVEAVSIPVQLGGGLRSIEQVRAAFDVGVARVVLGTAAHEDSSLVADASALFPGRIAVGIDARDGLVATHGWRVVTDTPATELAERIQTCGASVIVYTDISRDGMMAGPNIEAVRALADALTIPVIASGGISSLADICSLREIVGVHGVIVGRALYEGRFTLTEALRVARVSEDT